MARRRYASYSSTRSTTKPRPKTKKVDDKPKMTAAELRKKLGTFQKEVRVDIPSTALEGDISQIAKKLKNYADKSEIKGTWKVKKVSSGGYYRASTTWCLVGSRPYTDEELLKEGPRLLVAKERKEKRDKLQRAKDEAKLMELASKLGVEVPLN